MSSLAAVYDEVGKLDQAERLWREVLEARRRTDSPRSVATAGVLAALGTNLLKQAKFTEAEPPLRDCLAIREKEIPTGWSRFNALSLLGAALLGQRDFSRAEPLLLEGYEGLSRRKTAFPGPPEQRLTEAAERLIQLYEATKHPEKAHVLRKAL